MHIAREGKGKQGARVELVGSASLESVSCESWVGIVPLVRTSVSPKVRHCDPHFPYADCMWRPSCKQHVVAPSKPWCSRFLGSVWARVV